MAELGRVLRCCTRTPTATPPSSSSRPSRRWPPGADVLVLDAFDTQAAVSIVLSANAQGVPVISYDRLIAGGDLAYYISFDNELVGDLQATEFVRALEAAGAGSAGVLLVNGSPTDSNAAQFREGARRVIDASDLRVLAEYDTPGWSPEKAQEWVAGQIAQYGDEIAGVYAANDGVAGGAISALKAANVSPFPRRDRTGCRAGRDPADPHRRPADDRLQGDPAAGRARRRGRRRPHRGRGDRRRRWRSRARRRPCSSLSR